MYLHDMTNKKTAYEYKSNFGLKLKMKPLKIANSHEHLHAWLLWGVLVYSCSSVRFIFLFQWNIFCKKILHAATATRWHIQVMSTWLLLSRNYFILFTNQSGNDTWLDCVMYISYKWPKLDVPRWTRFYDNYANTFTHAGCMHYSF